MIPILLDTGVIVALLDRRERYHRACAEALAGLGRPLATTEPVITESCYLLRRLPGAAAAVLENVERGIFQVPLRLADTAGPVRRLIEKYRDIPADLADATLIHLARELGTGDILTLDRHFTVYRRGGSRRFHLPIALA